jgi:DNA (cytosine-5)-methyltransferase 1
MRHGSLFSGIGGFDLAAEWMGWENVFHCEKNDFGRNKLKGYWPNSISYEDITDTDFSIHRGQIDILTGGFPCQDASKANQSITGKQGLQGARTGLFYEMCRAIRETGPKVVVAENVANILKTNGGKDFSRILSELSSMGYNAEWRVCRASEVGAPHHRARLYLVAYPNSIRLQKGQSFFQMLHEETRQVAWESAGTSIQTLRSGPWATEPPALCVANGLSTPVAGWTEAAWRKEQIMGYGNTIVPHIAHGIYKMIDEII